MKITIPKITAPSLIRWSGLTAVLAGASYALVGILHPANVAPSVVTSPWEISHILAMSLSLFGLFGLTGLYARQAEKSGWLGLSGYLLLSLWLMLMLGFTFVEVFILPAVAITAPTFIEGFLGMFTGFASEIELGALPIVWGLTGPMYILGGILFGIATFRAGTLSRWAGVLLAAGTALGPVAALFPLEHQPKVAVPVGLALIWLGYSLWSEHRTKSASLLDTGTPALRPAQAR